MTKKSAAKVKPVKDGKSISEERTPEEYFNEAKAGLDTIISSYIKNCMRIDNVFDLYLAVKDISDITFPNAISLSNLKQKTYEEVRNRISSFKFDDFINEEMPDPFADMLEYIDGNEHDLYTAIEKLVKFNSVRPFGEKVEQLHYEILQKME